MRWNGVPNELSACGSVRKELLLEFTETTEILQTFQARLFQPSNRWFHGGTPLMVVEKPINGITGVPSFVRKIPELVWKMGALDHLQAALSAPALVKCLSERAIEAGIHPAWRVGGQLLWCEHVLLQNVTVRSSVRIQMSVTGRNCMVTVFVVTECSKKVFVLSHKNAIRIHNMYGYVM